jgi:hypothetical protein
MLGGMKQVFAIVPAAGGTAFWTAFGTLAVISVVLFGTMVLFAYMAYSLGNVRVEVSEEGLRITGDIYGRRIAAPDLVAGEARRIDVGQDPEHRLSGRTNGIGLPGYRSGWFRLRNGEKSLVFVTDTQRVVYIPTRLGYSVLLSVAEPAAAIEIALQRKGDAIHVCVVADGSDQTGLTQGVERVAQSHQPTSQATAGCVADPHVLDHLRRANSTLVQIGNRLAMAV